ncbi:MAG: peptidylprolyl isomerase [Acidobacteriota bacterium]|nr:MAG: peptidylprolyl isomerase [Acidobacteriota bacterium]
MNIKILKKLTIVLLLGLLAASCSDSSKPAPATTSGETGPSKLATPNPAVVDNEVAVIETDYGKIKIRFYKDVAPRHVENFKKLIREKFYDGVAFHRVIPGNIIQGGDPSTRSGPPSQWGMGLPGQPTIAAEFNTRPFVRGTVGMARRGGDINSATSQFFICLEDHPEWTGAYTVFGAIQQGLETVRMISNVESDPMTQRVLKKVVMKRVYLEPVTD